MRLDRAREVHPAACRAQARARLVGTMSRLGFCARPSKWHLAKSASVCSVLPSPISKNSPQYGWADEALRDYSWLSREEILAVSPDRLAVAGKIPTLKGVMPVCFWRDVNKLRVFGSGISALIFGFSP